MHLLKVVDKTNAAIWFVIGGFCTLCIPETSNFYWAAAVGTCIALLNIYVSLFMPMGPNEYDGEFKPTLAEYIFRAVFHAINPFYWITGMMYLSSNTDRYRPIRPGDAFAMMDAVRICIMYGMPILNIGWFLLWTTGLIHLSFWWLLAGNIVLFLSPPVYATLKAEYYLWQYNKDPTKFWH